MTDQHRYDAVQFVQNELSRYDGKLKVRTPNIDRIMKLGAYFRKAYCHSPVCGPARGVLRTGCTLERSGLQANRSELKEVYEKMDVFKTKVESIVTLDQILSEELGYQVEYYGKWHLPEISYLESDGVTPAVKFNDYNYDNERFKLSMDETWRSKLQRYLKHSESKGRIKKEFKLGDQIDTYTGYPYTPIQIDSRYGLPTGTSFGQFRTYPQMHRRHSQGNINGPLSLGKEYSPVHFNGDIALKALDRLAQQESPFALTVSFHNPHGPITPTAEYLEYYWENRDMIYLDPNIDDDMVNSAYSNKKYKDMGYDNKEKLQEWIACYYALIEEIDDHIGHILDKLDHYGLTENTMIVFTSDHGEMLGAHGMRAKNNFYEESVRVPLAIALPSRIPPRTIVDQAAGHLDLYATILDYLGHDSLNQSDGKSLRRFIDRTNINKSHDEEVVISEWDFRKPMNSRRLDRALGSETNFMVLKGNFKLMITKLAKSSRMDMLYDIKNDPQEVHNLIGLNGFDAEETVVGKAEHLKCLLIEWMERMDGPGYYSLPSHSDSNIAPFTDGIESSSGDITEIMNRRTWKKLDVWVSDTELDFGTPVWNGTHYVRNEFIYFGRTTPGNFTVEYARIRGSNSGSFIIDSPPKVVYSGNCNRLKVSFVRKMFLEEVDAEVKLKFVFGDYVERKFITLKMGRKVPTYSPTSSRSPTSSPTKTAVLTEESSSFVPTMEASLLPSVEHSSEPSQEQSSSPSSILPSSIGSSGPSSNPSTKSLSQKSSLDLTFEVSTNPSFYLSPSSEPSSNTTLDHSSKHLSEPAQEQSSSPSSILPSLIVSSGPSSKPYTLSPSQKSSLDPTFEVSTSPSFYLSPSSEPSSNTTLDQSSIASSSILFTASPSNSSIDVPRIPPLQFLELSSFSDIIPPSIKTEQTDQISSITSFNLVPNIGNPNLT